MWNGGDGVGERTVQLLEYAVEVPVHKLLLERAIPVALKAGKPGTEAFRSALRNALESEREVVGTQGVFNITSSNHNGMDERARVLVTVKEGKFRLLPE